MKKIAAILLAGIMCIGMSTSVFASEVTEPATETKTEETEGSETNTYSDMSTVNIKKIYKLENKGTISPAETFTVTQISSAVKDGDATSAPALGTITGASFKQGEATVDGVEKNITITLPEYDRVGVYEYTLKETVGTTGGVDYRSEDIKLVVTVIEQNGKVRVATVHTETSEGKKTDSIVNTYKAASNGSNDGGLQISKTVTGNLGDKNKYFKVTVKLNGETGKTYLDSYTVTGGSKMENGTNSCTSSTITIGTAKDFWIKDGETLTVENVPYGVTYTVDEDCPSDYTASGEVLTAEEVDANKETVSITNNKGGKVDTGINMDKAPYIVIFGIVILGAAVVLTKKRFSSED